VFVEHNGGGKIHTTHGIVSIAAFVGLNDDEWAYSPMA
jgi:hypothetical protein